MTSGHVYITTYKHWLFNAIDEIVEVYKKNRLNIDLFSSWLDGQYKELRNRIRPEHLPKVKELITQSIIASEHEAITPKLESDMNANIKYVLDYIPGKHAKHEDFNNLITYNGERLAAKALVKKWGVDRLAITDNSAIPFQSALYADFADTGSGDVLWTEVLLTPAYDVGDKIVHEFMLGFAIANFTWKKIGLIDKNNILIAEQAYNYSGKTSTSAVNIRWEISL